MGLIFLEQKKYDDALKEFSLILRRDPGDDRARYYSALAYEGKGDVRQMYCCS